MALNDANVEKVRVGYHETITIGFLALIATAKSDENEVDSDVFCLQHPELNGDITAGFGPNLRDLPGSFWLTAIKNRLEVC